MVSNHFVWSFAFTRTLPIQWVTSMGHLVESEVIKSNPFFLLPFWALGEDSVRAREACCEAVQRSKRKEKARGRVLADRNLAWPTSREHRDKRVFF